MAGSKKEGKQYANRSARRRSGDVIINQTKKSRKQKDTDAESLSSTNTSSNNSTIVVPPTPEPKRCPLRFMLVGMFESEAELEGQKNKGCPLRRVQLWHTIPLCLLAIVNLLLVIIALLGLAGYRIATGIQVLLFTFVKTDLDSPYTEDVSDGAIADEKD